MIRLALVDHRLPVRQMAVSFASLFTKGGPLLLDFDGPVCSIFAGYPAPPIAAELIEHPSREVLQPRLHPNEFPLVHTPQPNTTTMLLQATHHNDLTKRY